MNEKFYVYGIGIFHIKEKVNVFSAKIIIRSSKINL
jgi:hypothetical protein